MSALVVMPVVSGCTSEPSDEGQADEASSDTGSETASETTDESGDETGDALAPTWHQDIAPIVNATCSGCHRSGGVGPFSLETYAEAAPWGELALAAIESGAMPPWGQDNTAECQPQLPFLHDTRLSADELELFAAWVEAGTPEGDPATAAPLPGPPPTELADADHVLEIPSSIDIGPGGDQLWCFVIDPQFAEDVFVDATQVVPGNAAIVHHALVYVDETGESDALADAQGRYECFGGPEVDGALVAVWAPGVPPQETPEGVAMRIPAGAKLVMQVHYHPTGALETDVGTAVAFREHAGTPAYVAQYALPGNEDSQDDTGYGLQPGPADGGAPEFRIPAGAAAHTERMKIWVPPNYPELYVWSIGSHMHYLGVDMRISVDRFEPDPNTGLDEECFVQTPHYDFNWQRGYQYDAPLEAMPIVRAGDVVVLDCTYDNTMNNQNLVEALAESGLDAPIDVFLGEETLDEMCLAAFGVAAPYEGP